jgi:hypothetical protein
MTDTAKLTEEELDELQRLLDADCLELQAWRSLRVQDMTGQLIALIAAARRGLEDGWRDIETAPWDEMVLTLWDGINNKTGKPARYHNAAYHDSDRGTWVDEWFDDIDEPTHWQPIPDPPK